MLLLLYSLFLFGMPLCAADYKEMTVLKNNLCTYLHKHVIEITLCFNENGYPSELIPILYTHVATLRFKDIPKDTIYNLLKVSAQENDLETVSFLINCNSTITQGVICLNPAPDKAEGAGLICNFFDFVMNEKNNIKSKATINTIVSNRYPFAPFEAWYQRIGYTWNSWNCGTIAAFLKAGFVIPILLNGVFGPKPMLFYFTNKRVITPKSGTWLNLPPDFEMFEDLLKKGANPNYKHETRDYICAGNYTQTFQDVFEYIDEYASCTDEDKSKLKEIALQYQRTPINTIDAFYPGSRGYRNDLASRLKNGKIKS